MSVKNLKVDDYERSTAVYFNEIKNTQPLTKKEENKLWKSFREKNDFKAREKLINANLKFVPTIAKQFKGCGLPFADILEEGNIGLIRAIDRFDPKKDTKIISYAVWWIRKCIMEALDKKGMLDVENIDDVNQHYNDNDGFVREEMPTNLITLEKNEIDDNQTSTFFSTKQLVEELFDGVPEREKIIISDYYGLYGDEPKTLDEIGLELNLTKERVRQLNEKALKKMRSNALIKNISFGGF